MQEVLGSIWINYLVPGHSICITTNGVVKRNGEAVMGRGVAQQATEPIDGIAKDLGSYIRNHGNRAGYAGPHLGFRKRLGEEKLYLCGLSSLLGLEDEAALALACSASCF